MDPKGFWAPNGRPDQNLRMSEIGCKQYCILTEIIDHVSMSAELLEYGHLILDFIVFVGGVGDNFDRYFLLHLVKTMKILLDI